MVLEDPAGPPPVLDKVIANSLSQLVSVSVTQTVKDGVSKGSFDVFM